MSYEQFKVKVYSLWDLFLHERQFPYLGRCYAWAKRENAQKFTDMTLEEVGELMTIVQAWDRTIRELYHHDWPNLSILGNEAPHLHAHLIPRYHSLRNFEGIEFVDPNPQGNWSPYPRKEIPLETLLKIKNDILQAIA